MDKNNALYFYSDSYVAVNEFTRIIHINMYYISTSQKHNFKQRKINIEWHSRSYFCNA